MSTIKHLNVLSFHHFPHSRMKRKRYVSTSWRAFETNYSIHQTHTSYHDFYSQILIYLFVIWEWDSIKSLKRFCLTISFPVCSGVLKLKRQTKFSRGSQHITDHPLLFDFVYTLMTCMAFIFPVCLTWGPRHKSISGPHLK